MDPSLEPVAPRLRRVSSHTERLSVKRTVGAPPPFHGGGSRAPSRGPPWRPRPSRRHPRRRRSSRDGAQHDREPHDGGSDPQTQHTGADEEGGDSADQRPRVERVGRGRRRDRDPERGDVHAAKGRRAPAVRLTLFVRQRYGDSEREGSVLKKRLSFRVRDELASRIASGRIAAGLAAPARARAGRGDGRLARDAPRGPPFARGGRVRHADARRRHLRDAPSAAAEQPRRELRRDRGDPRGGHAAGHRAERAPHRGRVRAGGRGARPRAGRRGRRPRARPHRRRATGRVLPRRDRRRHDRDERPRGACRSTARSTRSWNGTVGRSPTASSTSSRSARTERWRSGSASRPVSWCCTCGRSTTATEGEPLLLSEEHHLADAFEFSVVRRGPGRRT